MQLYADEAVAEQMPILQQMLDAQPSIRNGEPWKEHANLLEMDMRNTDRWRNEEDMGTFWNRPSGTVFIRAGKNEGLCLEFRP